MIQSEVKAEKHARYKVAAMQDGITLKKLFEKSLDDYMVKYHTNLMVVNLKLS